MTTGHVPAPTGSRAGAARALAENQRGERSRRNRFPAPVAWRGYISAVSSGCSSSGARCPAVSGEAERGAVRRLRRVWGGPPGVAGPRRLPAGQLPPSPFRRSLRAASATPSEEGLGESRLE